MQPWCIVESLLFSIMLNSKIKGLVVKTFFYNTKLALVVAALFGVIQFSAVFAKSNVSDSNERGSNNELPYSELMKYDMFELENGLRVIVHENRAAPLVSYLLSFHVGSKDEPEGKTGFAHLFEHLLFAGTETNPGEYFEHLAKLGGIDLNASTSSDFTSYFGTVPSSAFERTMWIEGDRMKNTIDSITPEVLATQIDVVKNEKGLSDNQPFGSSFTESLKIKYPANHPYSHDVIGSIEDLEGATMDDVRAWYEKYYGARNIVLSLAGDIDLTTAKRVATKYFGSLRAGPALDKQVAYPVKRVSNTYQKSYDVSSSQSLVRSFILPKVRDKDSYMPSLAAAIFSTGSTSQLSQALVEERELALFVGGIEFLSELNSEFEIQVVPTEGVSLDELSKALDEEIEKLAKRGFNKTEVERYYGVSKGLQLSNMETNIEKVFQMGEGLQKFGDPDFEFRKLEWIKNASIKDLNAAAKEWLTAGFHETQQIALQEFNDSRVTKDPGPKPEIKEAAVLDLAEPDVFKLDNGLEVVLLSRPESTGVRMAYRTPLAAAQQNAAERDLPAAVLGILSDSGLPNMSKVQQGKLISTLGAEFTPFSDEISAGFDFEVDTDGFEQGLDILIDILSRAEFDEIGIQEYVDENIEFAQLDKENTNLVRNTLLFEKIWGDEFSIDTPEYIQSLKQLDKGKVSTYYQEAFRPEGTKLYVVGDIEREQVETLLNKKTKHWVGSVAQKPIVPINFSAAPSRTKILIIDDKGATQTDIVAMKRLDLKVERLYREGVMNSIFGGSFTSRLNLNLREDKGWTYGISSIVSSSYENSMFEIGAAVTGANTVDAMAEILKEISEARSNRPLTEDELETVKVEQVNQLRGFLVTNREYATLLYESDYYGEPYNSYEGLPGKIKDINVTTINQLLKEIVVSDGMVWGLVGDAAKIEGEVRAANFGDVEVYSRKGERLR